MVGEIVVARVQVPVHKLEQFWDASRKVDELLQTQEGYIGYSVWADATDGESFITVLESINERCAEEGFRALVDSPLFKDLSDPTEGKTVHRWIRVVESKGVPISQMAPNSYLSGSIRVAEPGQAEDLSRDYSMVFESLSLIDGFRGSAFGPVNQVSEQFIGLVWWDSREAFEMSVPRKDQYELRLFRRVQESEMHTSNSA